MTHGFLLPLACDRHVDRGRFVWNWDSLPADLPPHVPRSPIHFHMAEPVEGSPLFRPGWIPVKFRNLWAVEPEDGWSLLYTHPLNRFDLPYRTITRSEERPVGKGWGCTG